MTPDDDGSYFIDRDGKHFRHIVNYLRNGTISVELDTDIAKELAIEAEYYGLDDLAHVLQADTLDIARCMPGGIRIIRLMGVHKGLRGIHDVLSIDRLDDKLIVYLVFCV